MGVQCFTTELTVAPGRLGDLTAGCESLPHMLGFMFVDTVPVMVLHTLIRSSSRDKATHRPTSFLRTLRLTSPLLQVSCECWEKKKKVVVVKGVYTLPFTKTDIMEC